MKSIAALALASVAVANSLEDGNHLVLKGYKIPISGVYGDPSTTQLVIESYFDVGVFYKFPFNLKWGEEFQSAQELILYAGGKQAVDITLFDFFNIKVTALLYPAQAQLIRNDIYVLWPKDTFLDLVPEEADMTVESDNIELTAESDPLHDDTALHEEGQLTEEEWFCMDTKYGYQLGWYLIKLQLGVNGCDFSLYDKFVNDVNFECAYNNYYFNKVLSGSLWGDQTWGLRYTCPWSTHLETTDYSLETIEESVVEDLEENTL